MNRKPYTKEEFETIVTRLEEKIGLEHFIIPIVSTIPQQVVQSVVEHSDECRCNTCVNKKLDEILAKIETPEELTVVESVEVAPVEVVEKSAIEIVTTAQLFQEECINNYNQYTEPYHQVLKHVRTMKDYKGSR